MAEAEADKNKEIKSKTPAEQQMAEAEADKNKEIKSKTPEEQQRDKEMEAILEKAGLDSSVWLDKFKSIAGATNPAALKQCGEESYNLLKKYAKTPVQVKLLKQFLGFKQDVDEKLSDDDKMSKILKEASLEPSVWLPKFREIGATTPQLLKLCGPECYDKLKKFAQSPIHTKALQLFLKMEDVGKIRQNQQKKLEEKSKKSKELLDHMKKLREEGKKRNDENVKALENSVRKALNISPTDWIPQSSDMNSLITQLESYNDALSGTLKRRSDYSSSKELIESISNGKMLKGIICTKDLLTKPCSDNLIRAHDAIIIRNTTLNPDTLVETFTSLKQEASYIKNIDKTSISASLSAGGGYGGVAAEASVSGSYTNETEKTKTHNKEKTYLSTVKNSIMPLATCSHTNNDSLLSDSALTALQDIEKLNIAKSSECEVQLACEKFIDTFGMCANRGPYHLGGMYWWKSFSEGFKEEDTEELKKMQSVAVGVSASMSAMSMVSASAELNVGHASGKYEGKHKKDENKRVTVTQGQKGGPPEVSNLPQWKDGLVASNTTWAIIGEEFHPMYVWEIIKLNHVNDFKDVEGVSKLISYAWERMVSSCMNPKFQKFLIKNQHVSELLNTVTEHWHASKRESDCLNNLYKLLEVKQKVISQNDKSNDWCDMCLCQTSIQCYLKWVLDVSIEEKGGVKYEAVCNVMQKILEYREFVQMKYFPDHNFFLKWLYPVSKSKLDFNIKCKDLNSLHSLLEKLSGDLEYHKVCNDSLSEREILEKVIIAVNSFCFQHKCESDYDSLLVVTLLLPLEYDTENRYFKKYVSAKHLNYFCTQLKKAIQTQSHDPLQKQLYLFLRALQTNNEINVIITEDMLNQHIRYLKQNIKPLDSLLQDALTKSQHQSGFNFKLLENKLREISQANKPQPKPVDPEDEPEDLIPDDREPKIIKIPEGSFKKLLMKLGCQQYFSQQLTLQDALIINHDRKDSKISEGTFDPKLLLFLMLEKLKMSNHNCRKVLLYELVVKNNIVKNSGKAICDDDSDDDSDDDEELKVLIHPMDSLLVLIFCSDNFLRQELYLKLNTSGLALPLILPDPVSDNLTIPLWCMRSITKYWKCKDVNDDSIIRSCQGRIVDCAVPMITFIRFSHPKTYSKSQIINHVMSDSKQEFFYNHECEGSSVNRELADGTVEAMWYLPAGEKSDLFNDLIMFANLRGNAGSSKHERQLKFLSYHSHMIFVFLSECDIKSYEKGFKIINSTKRGKLFVLSNECSKDMLSEKLPDSSLIKLAGKEPAKIVKTIRSKITSRLTKQRPPFFKISNCLEKNNKLLDDIITDEGHDELCQKGKQLATKILSDIEDIPAAEIKQKMVPMQGSELWHKWSALDKQQNRMKSDEIGCIGLEDFNSQKRRQKHLIRMEQYEKVKSLSPVMQTFTDVLLDESPEVRAYFLQWLKFFLDDQSSKVLPDLQKRCNATREKLRTREITDKKQIERMHLELQKLDEELIHASFGVEHLFREVGQMYECIMTIHDEMESNTIAPIVKKVDMLRKVAAQLLKSGYPLEIIDGDAAHIPHIWITDVLKTLEKMLKKSKLAVISVLGIQSTGKSTLMNTLFGVRFAVSAGRCTRGASFQLIKVNSNLVTGNLKCDYMLVIDTEGLRAPELDSQKTQQHDNELASLVIGLAGSTIINIFGEVPADINDILQTSVHAFLRMRKVELRPSCQFVRHHVSNVTAGSTSEGNQRFQRSLDEMTELAAKAEHCEGQYNTFSDVIGFNHATDVQNFPALWEGNPPMAPVNPAYCEAAEKLKSKFVGLAESPKFLCSVHEFNERVKTLWEAILRENFVFSFKNTLEVEAYAQLDAEYSNWSWRLQNHMLVWENETRNRIMATSADAESEQIKKIDQTLDSEYDKIMEDVDKFFDNPESSLASTMSQWRTRYEQKLQALREDHKATALRYCKELIKTKNAKLKVEEMKKDERDQIKKQLKELVAEMDIQKDKELSEDDLEEIQRKFDQKWEIWMEKIARDHPPIKKQNYEDKIVFCARNNCQLTKFDSLIVEKVTERPLRQRGQPLQLVLELNRHLNFTIGSKFKSKVSSFFNDGNTTETHISAARRETGSILSMAKEYLSQPDLTYGDNHIVSIVRTLMKEIQKFEKYNGFFTFTAEYRVDIILEVAGYALRVFNQIQSSVQENHPVTHLNSLRSSYSKVFKALCTATAQEKAAAICLSDLVDRRLQSTLMEHLTISLANDVMSNDVIFQSKKTFKGTILLNLAKKNNFQLYADHLKNISKSYLYWIEQYVTEYCRKKTARQKLKVTELAETALSQIVVKIKHAAEIAAENSKTADRWSTTFQESLEGAIEINEHELVDFVDLQENSDFKFFTEEFIKGVTKCEATYTVSFQTPESSQKLQLNTLIKKSAAIILNQKAGCCEQCPFCNEQCERTDSKHNGYDHHCTLHRPQCLGGYKDTTSRKMTLGICTDSVGSTRRFSCKATNDEFIPYKKYRDVYPTWNIPDEGGKTAPYWKWFIAKHTSDITNLFNCKEEKLPSDWQNISSNDVMEDIKKQYNLRSM